LDSDAAFYFNAAVAKSHAMTATALLFYFSFSL